MSNAHVEMVAANFRFIYLFDQCNEELAAGMTIQLLAQNVDVIFGPTCSYSKYSRTSAHSRIRAWELCWLGLAYLYCIVFITRRTMHKRTIKKEQKCIKHNHVEATDTT